MSDMMKYCPFSIQLMEVELGLEERQRISLLDNSLPRTKLVGAGCPCIKDNCELFDLVHCKCRMVLGFEKLINEEKK